jgi:hypothetical protein
VGAQADKDEGGWGAFAGALARNTLPEGEPTLRSGRVADGHRLHTQHVCSSTPVFPPNDVFDSCVLQPLGSSSYGSQNQRRLHPPPPPLSQVYLPVLLVVHCALIYLRLWDRITASCVNSKYRFNRCGRARFKHPSTCRSGPSQRAAVASLSHA